MTDEELRAMLEAATPGPWFACSPGHYHGWWVVSTSPDGCGCIDASGDGGFNEDEARLIAAAPDLAAEVLRLRAALRYYGEGTGDMGEYARAALGDNA